MKKFIFKSSLFITLIFTLSFGVLVFGIEDTQAQAGLKNFVPQVEIPGLGSDMSVGEKVPGSSDMVQSTLLRDYVVGIYNYSFAIAGILAAIVLMGGGVFWLISGGSPDKIGKAKKIIGSSLVGLALLFGSHLILNTINPDLLKMKALTFQGVEGEKDVVPAIACCTCSGARADKKPCKSEVGFTNESCKKYCNNGDNYTLKFDHVCGTGEYEGTCVPLADAVVHPNGFFIERWTYQTGIRNQIGDMSSELVDFLNCMSMKLPDNFKGEISSISDNNHIGSLGDCNNKSECPKTCQHTCGSCHYGGGIHGAGSFAVDLGDEWNAAIYKRAAQYCCQSGCQFYIESDHVHISLSPCKENVGESIKTN